MMSLQKDLVRQFELKTKSKQLKGCPYQNMTMKRRLLIYNTLTGAENMHKKPEIIVFASPNGSGKSTIIYDNSDKPFRIFKKRKNDCFYWKNEFWDREHINKLTNVNK